MIHAALRFERLDRPRVVLAPFALTVGAVGTAHVRPLGPFKPEPAQVLEQPHEQRVLAALGIGVLDAQHHAAAARPGGEVVEERRARVAKVQGTGRARGKACYVRDSGHIRACYRIGPADPRPRWPRCALGP